MDHGVLQMNLDDKNLKVHDVLGAINRYTT
jgi:hypothetical protein